MKTDKINTAQAGFSYPLMVLYGLAIEFILIGFQFIYLRIFTGEISFTFDDVYMRYGGFYIFQIIGFFLYITMVYLFSSRLENDRITKIAAFVVAGCLLEFAFYFTIQAEWKGVFAYSVLSKLIAGAFGIVMSLYIAKDMEHELPENTKLN